MRITEWSIDVAGARLCNDDFSNDDLGLVMKRIATFIARWSRPVYLSRGSLKRAFLRDLKLLVEDIT